jgi:hypothetical protein
MPLQITRAGVVRPTQAETAALARAFDDHHVVLLKKFLDPAILGRLQARLAQAGAWKANVHDLVNGPSTELVCSDEIPVGLLMAMFHDRTLWDTVAAISSCDPIRSFDGRVYRMDPGAHQDVWHTDANGDYMVTLSLNLTDRPFTGGELHLRDYASKRMCAEVANTGQGDAIIFRIDGGLEHIVTPVTGTVPKIAWAGWFRREPLLPALDRLAGLSGAW